MTLGASILFALIGVDCLIGSGVAGGAGEREEGLILLAAGILALIVGAVLLGRI